MLTNRQIVISLFVSGMFFILLGNLLIKVSNNSLETTIKIIPPPANSVLGETATASQTKVSSLIDINKSSLEELDTLPGIGPTYAKRIVEGRPYKSKIELIEKDVLPKNVYEKCKELIIPE